MERGAGGGIDMAGGVETKTGEHEADGDGDREKAGGGKLIGILYCGRRGTF